MEFAVLVKLAIWMPETFLYREKCIELIMNKTAVIIVLAIFISAYIPNLFMDVNTQSSVVFDSWTDDTLLQKKRNKNRDNVERAPGLLAETGSSENKNSTLFQCNKMETLTLWTYFKGKDFTSIAIILS